MSEQADEMWHKPSRVPSFKEWVARQPVERRVALREALEGVLGLLGPALEGPNLRPIQLRERLYLDRMVGEIEIPEAPDLNRPIDFELLGTRAANVLRHEGILTDKALSEKSEAELRRMASFGRKSYNEVREYLAFRLSVMHDSTG